MGRSTGDDGAIAVLGVLTGLIVLPCFAVAVAQDLKPWVRPLAIGLLVGWLVGVMLPWVN
ncbi:MAG: hypothetical protein HC796_07890 [Synechococcaceae cyanobacterium RL_1_2]|nr:hypothetical protein [Synechococcaceae cyanobacterium RL_1_2]